MLEVLGSEVLTTNSVVYRWVPVCPTDAPHPLLQEAWILPGETETKVYSININCKLWYKLSEVIMQCEQYKS